MFKRIDISNVGCENGRKAPVYTSLREFLYVVGYSLYFDIET